MKIWKALFKDSIRAEEDRTVWKATKKGKKTESVTATEKKQYPTKKKK